jgi:hypothetical protein
MEALREDMSGSCSEIVHANQDGDERWGDPFQIDRELTDRNVSRQILMNPPKRTQKVAKRRLGLQLCLRVLRGFRPHRRLTPTHHRCDRRFVGLVRLESTRPMQARCFPMSRTILGTGQRSGLHGSGNAPERG